MRKLEKGESEMTMDLIALSYTEHQFVDSENFKNMIKGNIYNIISIFDKVNGINNSIKKMQDLQDMAFELTKKIFG